MTVCDRGGKSKCAEFNVTYFMDGPWLEYLFVGLDYSSIGLMQALIMFDCSNNVVWKVRIQTTHVEKSIMCSFTIESKHHNGW